MLWNAILHKHILEKNIHISKYAASNILLLFLIYVSFPNIEYLNTIWNILKIKTKVNPNTNLTPFKSMRYLRLF